MPEPREERCYRICRTQTRFDLPGTQFEFEVDAGDCTASSQPPGNGYSWKRTFAKFEVLESWRRDGLHGFMKLPVPYDFCIGDPISCLLTFSVILREGFFPALVMVVKSNYIYILFVSIRF